MDRAPLGPCTRGNAEITYSVHSGSCSQTHCTDPSRNISYSPRKVRDLSEHQVLTFAGRVSQSTETRDKQGADILTEKVGRSGVNSLSMFFQRLVKHPSFAVIKISLLNWIPSRFEVKWTHRRTRDLLFVTATEHAITRVNSVSLPFSSVLMWYRSR
jgi:hypothetical protein